MIDRRLSATAFVVVGFASGWFLQGWIRPGVTDADANADTEADTAPPSQAPAGATPGATTGATSDATRAAFEGVYQRAVWGRNADNVGHSGTGSTMRATTYWRMFLTEFLKDNRITSVVDAGCGDWEFSQSIDWTGIDYKGYDIVEAVIRSDRVKFEKPNIHFFAADIVETELPPADLLIIKHVLQHLPSAAVQKIARQFPKYRHILLVNGVHPITLTAANTDIRPGDYRELDITAPPFNLRGARPLTYWDGFNMHQVVHLAGKR